VARNSLSRIKNCLYTCSAWFGAGLRDQNKALWGGFSVLQKQVIVFLRVIPVMQATSNKYMRVMAHRVALLPIGAYEPRKLMSYVHMNPQDAVHAHLDLQAHRSLRFTIELFS
jgi:L-ascorbate metabolism protein UlaG (beta-lactamase superfamily)